MKNIFLIGGFSIASALSTQAAVVFSEVITGFTEDSAGSNTFTSGVINTAAADGASFTLQVTVAATGGTADIGTNLGVAGIGTNQINNGETLTISGITVTNFVAGALTTVISEVTNLGFSSITLISAQGNADQGTITLGGATPISWANFDAAQGITGHDPSSMSLDIVANQMGAVGSVTLADTSATRGHALSSLTITGMTVPEPTSSALLGLGGLALLSRRTRK